MANANKLPWAQFNRFQMGTLAVNGFFGVVTKDGEWVDSAEAHTTAVALAAQFANGGQQPETMREACSLIQQQGLSIIHSDLLRKMYEAGLIK